MHEVAKSLFDGGSSSEVQVVDLRPSAEFNGILE